MKQGISWYLWLLCELISWRPQPDLVTLGNVKIALILRHFSPLSYFFLSSEYLHDFLTASDV